MTDQAVPCVGALIKDRAGRLLLVRRGRPPAAGLWSLPGGRVEPGESDQQAVVREIAEETGLRVRCGALLGSVTLPWLAGRTAAVRDYRATVTGDGPAAYQLAAGDDAADARWVDRAELAALPLTAGLFELLQQWDPPPR
ncbi:MAG TPA: NUDIX domain-containing protein [Streptosporangiaceae bacterium]